MLRTPRERESESEQAREMKTERERARAMVCSNEGRTENQASDRHRQRHAPCLPAPAIPGGHEQVAAQACLSHPHTSGQEKNKNSSSVTLARARRVNAKRPTQRPTHPHSPQSSFDCQKCVRVCCVRERALALASTVFLRSMHMLGRVRCGWVYIRHLRQHAERERERERERHRN